MAEIRKIVKSSPLSNFRQAAPEAGGAFRFLAGALDQAYDFLQPMVSEEMKARGTRIGHEIARQQIGDPAGAVVASSMGGGSFRSALRQSESGGDYSVVNSEGYTGGYQWGPDRLADYNRANGTSFTLDQFKDDPALQERAQDWHEGDILSNLGGYVGRSVNGQVMDEGAIMGMAHLGGVGGARRYIESGGAYDPADSNGTSLSDYARKFGGTSVTMSSKGSTPPTMLRQADGALVARLYSPLAGPMLQASNAAAGVAYQADVILKSQVDLMDLSTQFQLNPEGYRQAATGYLDDLVKAAPEAFREDLRAGVEKEMQRRYLGMVEEKQRDTMQRANNSSAALADRWGDNLAQAIAGGNPDEIAAARTELGSVLAARERLPGVAWTPEQSQNVILKAEDAAAKLIAKTRNDQGKAWKSTLGLVAESAMAGRTAADESILQDPMVRSMFPDEWREAAASVTLRDEMPSFLRMTPAEQVQALTEMRAQPVTADWEMDLYDAAERAAKGNAAAWEADPIKQASAVLPEKPPALPDAETVMQNPQSLVDSLAARVAYGQKLKDQGYTDFVSFFTDEEASTFGAVMGKDTPPEIKSMLAGAIVAAAGPNAVRVFQELKSDDPVTMHAGMLMARGGDPAVSVMAMTGQAKLDQGLVQAPRKATTVAAVDPDIAAALAQLPNSPKASGDTLKFATAIWAAGAPPGGEDEATETQRMSAAMQQALGQSKNKRGDVTGGVQTIAGNPVLLPPGMSGTALDGALRRAFSDSSGMTFSQRMAMVGGYTPPGNAALWGDAGAPMLGGQPLKPSDLEYVQLTPEGGNRYRLALNINGQIVDAATADGAPFIFDAAAMIGAAK